MARFIQQFLFIVLGTAAAVVFTLNNMGGVSTIAAASNNPCRAMGIKTGSFEF